MTLHTIVERPQCLKPLPYSPPWIDGLNCLCVPGFSLPAEPVKRSATNSIFPFDATKKPKLSQSASEVQGKNHLALLLEYKPGLEFVMKSEPGKNNATLFTATVEIDGKV